MDDQTSNTTENEQVVDVLDIEECAKKGEKPGKAKKYRVRIDREKKDFSDPEVTGEELLKAVGKSFQNYKLFQFIRGQGKEEVKADDVVNLRTPGVERFRTLKLNTREG